MDLKSVFKNYVPNFSPSSSSTLEQETRIGELKHLIETRAEGLVNIFAVGDNKEVKTNNHANEFTEEGRYGGLGKTMLLQRCRLYAYILYADKTTAVKKLSDLEITNAAKKKFPLIELAEQYNTRKDILVKIVDNLCLIDSTLETTYFKDFYDVFGPLAKINTSLTYDPSYKAEILFKEATANIIKSEENWRSKPLFLFIDAFDTQYLGGAYSPLRAWLKDVLFPYLIEIMSITIFVSGRERVVSVGEEKTTKIKEGKRKEFRLASFSPIMALDYLKKYTNRVSKERRNEAHKKDWLTKVIEPLSSDEETSKLFTLLWKYTDGKPIFIDYFADLAYRTCVEKNEKNEKNEKTIAALLKEATGASKSDFKKYVINRLHFYQLSGENEKYSTEVGQALMFLSLARHGLTPLKLVKFRYGYNEYSKELEENYLGDHKRLYENIFSSEKGLTYVKDRGTTSEPIRLLHDELAELFIAYYYGEHDSGYRIRNKYIDFLLKIYEDELVVLGENHPNYPKVLLEYIEYSLTYRDKEREKQAIDRLLYEFSLHLDKHPDLCSRILEKGYKYYRVKEQEWAAKKQLDNALNFDRDYNTLAKIRLREVVYCLTERGTKWSDRVKTVIEEVADYSDRFVTDAFQKEGIAARCLVTEGEQKFWNVEWLDGAKDIKKAKDLFYQIADSHGLVWAEHLLGFEAQRSGQFLRAAHYHRSAIEGSISHFEHLRLQIRRERNKNKRDLELQQAIIKVMKNLDFEALQDKSKDEIAKIIEQKVSAYSNEIEKQDNALQEAWAIIEQERKLDGPKTAKNKTDKQAYTQKLSEALSIIRKNNQAVSDSNKYRLHLLLKTINRANSNWAINYRYRGKILEAIKILESNIEIAEIVGSREVVRSRANLAQLYAIRGVAKESQDAYNESLDYLENMPGSMLLRRLTNVFAAIISKNILLDDATLKRRWVLSATIMLGKNLINTSNLDIASHIQQVDTFNKSQTINIEQTLLVREAMMCICQALPKQAATLSIEEDTNMDFKVTDLLSKLSDDGLSKIFGNKNISREIGDLYYQYGKLALSAKVGLEQADYFEEARLAFENARFIAKRATFKYLEMEACEILFRLTYLSPQHKTLQEEYKQDFLKLQDDVSKNEKDYGIYHDLLAKFYLTEADIDFQTALETAFAATDTPPQYMAVLTPVLNKYATALYHGHEHNQERYVLILNAFADRTRTLFKKVAENKATRALLEDLKTFFAAQQIAKKDDNFKMYLPAHLLAACIEAEGVVSETEMQKVRTDIGNLVKASKFLKAADVNQSLMNVLKQSKANEPRLFLQYYQQYYCYLTSIRQQKTEELVSDFERDYLTTPSVNKGLAAAVFNLMKGTSLYRVDEFWNMERFIKGEMPNARTKFPNKENLGKAEELLIKVIEDLSKFIKNGVHEKYQRGYTKLLNEAFFRLGELYLILEKPVLFDTKIKSNAPLFLPDDYIQYWSENGQMGRQVDYKRFTDKSPAIFCLACAAYGSHLIKDIHREVNALQSCGKAVYLMSDIKKKTIEQQQERVEGIVSFYEKQRERVKEYATVESRIRFGEGNLYFSMLFEHDDTNKKETVFNLKKDWEKGKDWVGERVIFKAMLHKMMWYYLSALDCMTDRTKEYENYHFNNMLFEINRRVLLINKRSLVRMLIEDLRAVWYSFENLRTKNEVLDSLEFSLKTHEVALASKKILKKNNP